MSANISLTNGVGSFNATTQSLNVPSITATDVENPSLTGSQSGVETATPKPTPTKEPVPIAVSSSQIVYAPILFLAILFLLLGAKRGKPKLLVYSRKLRFLLQASSNIVEVAEVADSEDQCPPEQAEDGLVTSSSSTKRTRVKRNWPVPNLRLTINKEKHSSSVFIKDVKWKFLTKIGVFMRKTL